MAKGARGGMSEQLLHTGISVVLVLALATVLVSMFAGIGQQINNSLPAPTTGSIFYNITSTVNKGINNTLGLIGPVFIISVAVIIMVALWWVFSIIRGF
jgi:flagellar biosynthesis protein FliQ